MLTTATATTQRTATTKGAAWYLIFEEFARVFIHIRNKQGQAVRLKLNPMQRAWLAQCTARTITLKARQHGISTLIEARMFFRACTRTGYRGVIIAQDTEQTERLREKVRFMYDKMVEMGAMVPRVRYNSKAELAFEGMNSTLYIGKAGGRAFGRGDTVSEVHASELAFWPDPERLLTGLMEAVPQGGEIHIESTANGYNDFYTLCEDALQGKGNFKLIFLPWYLNPEYVRTPGIPNDEWTDEERIAASKASAYGIILSGQQVAFRREKQHDLKDRLVQEYAEDSTTCFLLSGRPRFDMEIMNQMLAASQAPARVKEFADCQLTYREWEPPQPGKFYVIGADAAQGISDRDYSVGCVVDWQDGRQVAELHGRADPSMFADRLALIGYQYNTAVINPERKESGIAVVSKLNELGYPRMFYYLDEKGNLAEQAGFDTNTHTKPLAVEAVGELISDYPAAFPNREEIAELMRFVVGANGKTEAEQGAHDDRVAARWCAEIARGQVRPPRTEPLARRQGLGKQR